MCGAARLEQSEQCAGVQPSTVATATVAAAAFTAAAAADTSADALSIFGDANAPHKLARRGFARARLRWARLRHLVHLRL